MSQCNLNTTVHQSWYQFNFLHVYDVILLKKFHHSNVYSVIINYLSWTSIKGVTIRCNAIKQVRLGNYTTEN